MDEEVNVTYYMIKWQNSDLTLRFDDSWEAWARWCKLKKEGRRNMHFVKVRITYDPRRPYETMVREESVLNSV
jgi:hypothetical protein